MRQTHMKAMELITQEDSFMRTAEAKSGLFSVLIDRNLVKQEAITLNQPQFEFKMPKALIQ
jgi:hypothetical protein